MIISTACERALPEFKSLVEIMNDTLNEDAKKREDYYTTRGGKKLEEDVYTALSRCAMGTDFENTIQLVSGASFPDIVANNMFGVEVKSTQKNQWRSIGSSILESTRNQDVERIYMTFGKLGKPVQFISKPYEDCLSEIAVTHYPRYRIDMQLQEKGEETIFEKMGIEYDELRKKDNPVPDVSNYYKENLSSGESLWWSSDTDEEATSVTVRLWTALSCEEKEKLIVDGYVLFPEVLGSNSTKKYNRYALWLATQRSVVNTNIRDSFSAGGQVNMTSKEGICIMMPAVFGRIRKYKNLINTVLYEIDEKTLQECWGEAIQYDRLRQWCSIVANSIDTGFESSVVWDILSVIFPSIDGETSFIRQVAEKDNFD